MGKLQIYHFLRGEYLFCHVERDCSMVSGIKKSHSFPDAYDEFYVAVMKRMTLHLLGTTAFSK